MRPERTLPECSNWQVSELRITQTGKALPHTRADYNTVTFLQVHVGLGCTLLWTSILINGYTYQWKKPIYTSTRCSRREFDTHVHFTERIPYIHLLLFSIMNAHVLQHHSGIVTLIYEPSRAWHCDNTPKLTLLVSSISTLFPYVVWSAHGSFHVPLYKSSIATAWLVM